MAEITYLGQIKDLDKINLYHIITNYQTIDLLSPRGISKIICISEDLSEIIIYLVGEPNELSITIENNALLFHIENKQIRISISGGLPPMICIPQTGCY